MTRGACSWRVAAGFGRRQTFALLATSASLAISAERPAISECRCATLAGAGLVSVPARERNQGSGLSSRGDGRPEPAAGLAAGESQVAADLRRVTCRRAKRGRDQSRPTSLRVHAADGKRVLHADGPVDRCVDCPAVREVGDEHDSRGLAGRARFDSCGGPSSRQARPGKATAPTASDPVKRVSSCAAARYEDCAERAQAGLHECSGVPAMGDVIVTGLTEHTAVRAGESSTFQGAPYGFNDRSEHRGGPCGARQVQRGRVSEPVSSR